MLDAGSFLDSVLLSGPLKATVIEVVSSDDVFAERKLTIKPSSRCALMTEYLVLQPLPTDPTQTSRRPRCHPYGSMTPTTNPRSSGKYRSFCRNESNSSVLAARPNLNNDKKIEILAEPRSKFRPRTEKESECSAHYVRSADGSNYDHPTIQVRSVDFHRSINNSCLLFSRFKRRGHKNPTLILSKWLWWIFRERGIRIF